MEQRSNIYAEEVKKRMVKAFDSEKLVEGTHICKRHIYNFIDGKTPSDDFNFTYHQYAASLNSSQMMCINFFKKFFENNNYKKLLVELLKNCELKISEGCIAEAAFEYRPDRYENTNLDFFMRMSDGQKISFEVKFTEPDFGSISKVKKGENIYRYRDSWNKNYSRLIKNSFYFSSDLQCDKDCECTEGGVLKNCCDKTESCGVYKFYENFQINRNILYAETDRDIVVFLTPRENFFLNSGRRYIEQFAAEHNTPNIVNLYWEDVIEKTLVLTMQDKELNDYMMKFKNKYFSEPLSISEKVLTEKGFIEYVENQAKENISTFYKHSVVNFRGRTEDTNQLFTELICKWLIENIDILKDIKSISRKSSYKTLTHEGVIKKRNSGRNEEILAKDMFNQGANIGAFDVVGKIIDYQTPLKNVQKDEAGKIDLLAYDGATVRILELKVEDSPETMLRCVLEGYTYLATVDKAKLLADFGLPQHTVIKACPLVGLNSMQHDEMTEDRPKLKELMEMLGIESIYYKEENGKYLFVQG